MTTKTASLKQAEARYTANYMGACAVAESITEKLDQILAPSDDFTPDWGDVGSLSQILRLLEETEEFMVSYLQAEAPLKARKAEIMSEVNRTIEALRNADLEAGVEEGFAEATSRFIRQTPLGA